MSALAPQEAIRAGVCVRCGKSITHPGPDGECVRCLVSFGFLSEDQEAERDSESDRVRLGPLRYAHFEVEVNADGYPVILGSGAMAVTYLARDTVLNSTVALKVISRKLAEDSTARARFLREARAAAQIHHPNVARVIHYGEQDGECFYAMELVHGETLEERVRRAGPLPLNLALATVEQTARGLAAGEECGVIHRDLKPSNLMIESHAGDQSLVKIIDYGVAKVLAPQADATLQTQAGFIGTPAFASPEQFNEVGRQQIDTRSDIYSLGVTFWYLLTAQMPFAGHSIEEVRAKQSAALPLHQLRSAHVPLECVALLKSMLATDPAKRPQTARDLLTRIHRCYVRFEPAARRRRKRVVVVSVGLALLLVVIGVLFWWRLGTAIFASIGVPAMTTANRTLTPQKSIAVLPFENLSENKANEFFADGVQDEILTDLSRIADLKVISRTSVMHYKSGLERNLRDIGQQLRVANVLEGSVQRAGNRVRVNVQLIDARTDQHLWAQTYDRDLADVFAIQSEVAKTIADQLQAKLSPGEKKAIERAPTDDITAFDLYTHAKNLLMRLGGNLGDQKRIQLEAVDLLNEAVARDPAFFDAYCKLAWAHDYIYILGYDHTSARLALADAAVEAAARLRPDAGETHLARAQNLYQGYLDYDGAMAELEATRRTLPNDPRVFLWKGLIERRQGRWEESTRDLERGLEVDPRNFLLLEQAARSYQVLRRHSEEKAIYDRILVVEPGDVGTKAARALVELNLRADTRPLHETIDSVRATNSPALSSAANEWLVCALAERDAAAAKNALIALGDNPIDLQTDNVRLNRPFVEGVIARMTTDDEKARSAFTAARIEQEKTVQSQPKYGPALCVLGLIDAGLGRKEEALREGRRAVELLPSEKDALQGSAMPKYLAMIAAWVGDKDLACEQLAIAVRSTSGLTYGQLKLSPFWDPLRGDPRFEELVEEAKKPVAVK